MIRRFKALCKGTISIVLAGSPFISGAVIRRCCLQFYIQFISLLVAYSSYLAPAVLCLMPYALPSFLGCCSAGFADLLYWALMTPMAIFAVSAIPLFLGSCSPFLSVTSAMHALIVCLQFACSDSVSGFPGL